MRQWRLLERERTWRLQLKTAVSATKNSVAREPEDKIRTAKVKHNEKKVENHAALEKGRERDVKGPRAGESRPRVVHEENVPKSIKTRSQISDPQ